MADFRCAFYRLPDDVVLKIFFKLDDDPRNWARLACVCTKFSSLIRNICCKTKCNSIIPAVVADVISSPNGWSAMHKLAVCCPGLFHAGVLLEHSDFCLERELGPDEEYQGSMTTLSQFSSSGADAKAEVASDGCSWSLFDDLYHRTAYNASESGDGSRDGRQGGADKNHVGVGRDFKRRKIFRLHRSHLASGVWNLCREQGNKLLASRFRGDCLYICDWPGCAHMVKKRNYMLFRGIFKNFKQSRVWRTINDGNRSKIDLNCAFCGCKETWDLHSAFCLRRSFGYHYDDEPVVRAYVCENGHVSGAWTDLPLYT